MVKETDNSSSSIYWLNTPTRLKWVSDKW
jgi:hypothetical protein